MVAGPSGEAPAHAVSGNAASTAVSPWRSGARANRLPGREYGVHRRHQPLDALVVGARAHEPDSP